MKEYIKKFWKALLGGLVFGTALAVLLGIPIRFVVSLVLFVLILNTIIEQARNLGAVTDVVKKIGLFAVGVLIFVGLRAITGYFLDTPVSQAYNDLIAGSGLKGVAAQRLSVNIAFELLFLVPGIGIAYLVIKEGRGWRTAMVITSVALLAWVGWTMKQKMHAESMKRYAAAGISLSARAMNNSSLANEAAASTSFGVAITNVDTFYSWNGSNIAWKAITNTVPQGQRVLQLHPNEAPVIFEGQAFTEVVLPGTNGSFVGGIKAWVEAWRFTWVDGRNAITPTTTAPTAPAVNTYVFNQDEVISALSVPDKSTVHMEADKAFCMLERNGTNPDGSEKLSKLSFPPGKSQKYFAWGGTIRLVGLYTNTTVKLNL